MTIKYNIYSPLIKYKFILQNYSFHTFHFIDFLLSATFSSRYFKHLFDEHALKIY